MTDTILEIFNSFLSIIRRSEVSISFISLLILSNNSLHLSIFNLSLNSSIVMTPEVSASSTSCPLCAISSAIATTCPSKLEQTCTFSLLIHILSKYSLDKKSDKSILPGFNFVCFKTPSTT